MAETRKTVLFIVEGPSDKEALEKIFKKIYKNERSIEFKFTNGDISSDPDITNDNVVDKTYDIVNSFLTDKKLRKTDIFQVIQIFDMDGAFIPESAITQGNAKEFVYTDKGITYKDIEIVKNRNERKTRILNHLLETKEIRGLSYEMYFMSCNLDHALYGILNLDQDKKMEYADAFYERFLDKENMFIEFLKKDVVNGVPDSFPASWNYIKGGLHSVERHTNLHIYFIKHPKPDGLL